MTKWLVPVMFALVAGSLRGSTPEDFLGTWTWIARTGAGQAIETTAVVPSLSPGVGRIQDLVGPHTITEAQVQGDTLTLTYYHEVPGAPDVPIQVELTLSGTVTVTRPNFTPTGGVLINYYSAAHVPLSGGSAPSFAQQPASQTVNKGGSVTFSVAASGASSISYQWLKDRVPVLGATSATLTLSNVSESDAGDYACSASGSSGTALSNWATLTVKTIIPGPLQPTIVVTSVPKATRAVLGAAVTFSVVATADGPLTYQWLKDGLSIPSATSSTFVIAHVGLTDAGVYSCRMSCSLTGVVLSTLGASLTVTDVPKITMQPSPHSVAERQPFTLELTVTTDSGPVTFKWYHDATLVATTHSLAGERLTICHSSYSIATSTPADAGEYYCVAENAAGQVVSDKVTVTVNREARIVNLSSRAMTGGAAGMPILGFVISGPDQVHALIRAVGPSLSPYGVQDVVSDPVLKVLADSKQIDANDNWTPAQAPVFVASGAFALADASKDAACVRSMAAGSYTVFAGDSSNREGVILAEAYDSASRTSQARFVNASTRGYVGPGERAMVTGFIITGAGKVNLLIRAVGPTLRGFGVEDAVDDPRFDLFQKDQLLTGNDNWDSSANAAETAAASAKYTGFKLAAGSKDAAMVVHLPEGGYTVVTTGGAQTGAVLIELYVLP